MSPNARSHVGDEQLYHIVTRGNNRMRVFHDADDFGCYLELLFKYREKFPLHIHHYCLMSNHVHLLVQTLRGEDLQRFMQGVNQSYARYYKREFKHHGHLWQGRYKSLWIDKDAYLLECGRYIERNPVRAGMVKRPEAWDWSSYRYYALGRDDEQITAHGLYLELGKTESERRYNYRKYVEQERAYEKLLDKVFHIS